jgi:hypothetical protein
MVDYEPLFALCGSILVINSRRIDIYANYFAHVVRTTLNRLYVNLTDDLIEIHHFSWYTLTLPLGYAYPRLLYPLRFIVRLYRATVRLFISLSFVPR